MGTLIKFLIFFLFTFDTTYSQIINIEKTDSIILNKKKELKEGNNVFYKNEYSLIVYNKENISYNNKNGFSYKVFAGGRKYCDKCKREEYLFTLKKNTSLKKVKNLNFFSVNTLFKNLKKYQFSYGYFCIEGVYYENLGMPIE